MSELRATGFVNGIHRWLVNFRHEGPVARKMFPFDDVIIIISISVCVQYQREESVVMRNVTVMCEIIDPGYLAPV